MLLSGDEVLNTQKVNNNSYCQDNELAWFDWTLVDKNTDMLRFVRGMIALRKRHPSVMRRRFLTGNPANGRELPDIRWYGLELSEPQWNDADSHLLRFTLAAVEENEADLHVILNLSTELLKPELPQIQGRSWHLCVDTALPSPDDITSPDIAVAITTSHYPSQAQSIVVLEAS
jgi:glycogen operon protein